MLRIQNLAPIRRSQWFTFTRPTNIPMGLVTPLTNLGGSFAVAGLQLGPAERPWQVWHAFTTMDAAEDVTSVIGNPIPADTAGAFAQTVLAAAVDEYVVAEIAPSVAYIDQNGKYLPQVGWSVVAEIQDGPADLIHLRARVPGTQWVSDMFVWLYAGQPFFPFELMVTASNPTIPDIYSTATVELDGRGAFVFIEAANTKGPMPGRINERGTHVVKLLTGQTFTDTQSQAFRGCFMIPGAVADPNSLATMQAQMAGPIAAVSDEWAQVWGPWNLVPPTRAEMKDLLALMQGRWVPRLVTPAGSPWQEPFLGQRAYSGITGDQDDFGPAQGREVLAVPGTPPMQIWELYHAALAESMRPNHQREADGSRINPENYPGWITDAGYTHWSTGVCPERLGKGVTGWIYRSGDYAGPDREHWSNKRLTSAYLLTGSPILRELIKDQITVVGLAGETVDPSKITSHSGAPRAIGRTMESLCWLWLSDGDPKLKDRIQQRIQRVIYPECVKPASYAVQPLVWRDPDPRVLQGKYRWWAPWEHSLAVMGLDAAWQLFKMPEIKELIVQTCRLNIKYGWWRENGAWVHGKAVRWLDDGAALPPSVYENPDDQLESYDGYNRWGFPAVKIALRLGAELGDGDLISKCKSIHDQLDTFAKLHGQSDVWSNWLLFSGVK